MFDDLEPVKKNDGAFPRNLENMSVDELQNYIAELRIEIERAEIDIEKKKASVAAAAAVFGQS